MRPTQRAATVLSVKAVAVFIELVRSHPQNVTLSVAKGLYQPKVSDSHLHLRAGASVGREERSLTPSRCPSED